jgi:hypothetical protein
MAKKIKIFPFAVIGCFGNGRTKNKLIITKKEYYLSVVGQTSCLFMNFDPVSRLIIAITLS